MTGYYVITPILTVLLIVLPILMARKWLAYHATPVILRRTRIAELSSFLTYTALFIIAIGVDLLTVWTIIKELFYDAVA